MALSTTQPVTAKPRRELPALPKAPTGIRGLDEVTEGGLPKGRPTLVCGPAGSGKTLLAMEFLVRGITDFGEPGVFMAFEETREDLVANVTSLGFDLEAFENDGMLVVDHVNVVASELVEAGDWDLEGLFIRLGAAIDSVGATRVVIDTIETLFGAFDDVATLRAELQRLFLWLKARGVTVVITGERGDGHLTRHGIEEYVSDCVIVLDHLVTEQTSTRRLRILKYRGSLARHQRVPVPDRRPRHLRAADHLAGTATRRLQRTGIHRCRPARRDARRLRSVPRQLDPGHRERRHGQVDAGGPVLRRRLRSRRAGDLLRL